jgi:hypothetical protein
MADIRNDIGPQGQATYGMANLRPATTGLSFIVFISQRDSASHAARVKVSREARVNASQLGSYSIDPFQHRAGPRLTSSEEGDLARWVSLNRSVLIDYWTGKILYTEEAISRLQRI